MTANSDRPFYIYVDVDDTFVRSASTKRMPMPEVIQHIRQLKEQGGADYARQSAEEFGIADYFIGFLPKPNALLDDQPINEWRYLKYVHPAESAGQTLDDYKRLRTLSVSDGQE